MALRSNLRLDSLMHVVQRTSRPDFIRRFGGKSQSGLVLPHLQHVRVSLSVMSTTYQFVAKS